MSWLLVAFIPGLLMLATFGLGRLESALADDTVSPRDVVEFLEQAKADCAKPAARATEDETYPLVDDDEDLHHAEARAYRQRLLAESSEGLPVRVFIHHGPNPEFQPTRHAFRV